MSSAFNFLFREISTAAHNNKCMALSCVIGMGRSSVIDWYSLFVCCPVFRSLTFSLGSDPLPDCCELLHHCEYPWAAEEAWGERQRRGKKLMCKASQCANFFEVCCPELQWNYKHDRSARLYLWSRLLCPWLMGPMGKNFSSEPCDKLIVV